MSRVHHALKIVAKSRYLAYRRQLRPMLYRDELRFFVSMPSPRTCEEKTLTEIHSHAIDGDCRDSLALLEPIFPDSSRAANGKLSQPYKMSTASLFGSHGLWKEILPSKQAAQ